MDLLPHNEEAYQKVMLHFKDHNKAAVVHATGTGKMYIIAAVTQNFKHPLIIAPNNFVLDEARKICPDYVRYKTYAGIMYVENFDKYDLIVLDEFHRSGADKWGDSVRALLNANPQAKVLGTSATHIRYLDNGRNMADELFDGNIVSHINLSDAITSGLIPNPLYVSTLYTFKETADQLIEKIDSSRYSTAKRKTEMREEVIGLAQNWDNAYGVPYIIKKYIQPDTKRIIVFSSHVSHSRHAKGMLKKWFNDAGFDKLMFYNIDYSSTGLNKKMKDFQKDGYEGIKIALTVNMLNEGVHIVGIDAIIMLRSTISRIIIEQQIGRCLTVENKGRVPVVLDLVDNMDNISYESDGFPNIEQRRTGKKKVFEYGTGLPFKVIDELRDVRTFYDEINREFESIHFWTKEECEECAKQYDTRSQFRKNEGKAYEAAKHNGWLNEICQHMKESRHIWTYEELVEEAKLYSTRKEFNDNSPAAYSAARLRNVLNDICQHMSTLRRRWSKEKCKSEAKKYTSRTEFQKNSKGAYNYAVRNKILTEVCAHMEDKKLKQKKEEK